MMLLKIGVTLCYCSVFLVPPEVPEMSDLPGAGGDPRLGELPGRGPVMGGDLLPFRWGFPEGP